MKQKRDTSKNWTANNPVLLNGETIIVDTESGEVREKVGDGTSSYTQLPFKDEVIRNLIAGKVSYQQGTEHAGKVLSVNSEGAVVPLAAKSYENSYGGFAGGSGSETGAGGASIGVNASSGTGRSAGHTATTQNGGAMGNAAASTSGFAGGARTNASTGAAVGSDAKAGAGFSGGYQAAVSKADGAYIDAIQLGMGTNETPKTLQVYSYQLLDANGKIPAGRLPDTVMTYRGEVISYTNLPESPEKGHVYSVLEYSPYPDASKPCKLVTGKVSDLFELHHGGFGTGCHALSIDLINANPDYCFDSSENPGNRTPGSHLYKLDGTYIGQIDYSGASNYIFDESCPYAYGPYLENLDGWDESLYYDSTISFIMCKTSGLTVYSLETYGIGMVMWDGSSWIRIPPEMGDVEAALDSILAIQNSLIGGGSE